jgi:hypothetical protein
MKPRFLVTGLLALIGFSAGAQTGSYFLSHFVPTDERIDYRSMDMAQDEKGEILFTNKAGVLEFDGLNWRVVPVPGAVYTIVANKSEVWVGGLAGIGKVVRLLKEPAGYQSLNSTPGFFSSARDSAFVYFCNDDQVVAYSLADPSVSFTIPSTSSTGHLLGVFYVGQEVVVRTEKAGLMKIQDKQLSASAMPFAHIIFSVASRANEYLIGTEDNEVFVIRNNSIRKIEPEDKDFLNNHLLVDGSWVNESLVAFGTLRGGVLFLNIESGEVEEVINYESGLPDNEVFALMTDHNEGVWVAHEYGFTRIAPNIPFRSFDLYTGLKGNLLCAQTFKDEVYVGTSVGLFRLEEEEVVKMSTNVITGNTRQSGFGVVKKKPNQATSKTAPQLPPAVKKGSHYRYVRINGIEGKVNQLIEANGDLIAAGIAGVFRVDGNLAERIVHEPVRSVLFSKSLGQLVVGTFHDQIKTFIRGKIGWDESHLLDTLRTAVNYFFEDKFENIWLCGRTSIIKVEAVDSEVTDILTYTIQNPMMAETAGLSFGNDVYIVASGQFYHYTGEQFVKYDSLPGARKYFASAGHFWFHDGVKWRTVDRRIQSLKLEWLGLFNHLRFLAPDSEGKSLWVITENKLYQFNQGTQAREVSYPLFLREVRGQEIRLAKEVEVDQEEGYVTFEFIQPDYVGSNATQYRYLVKGLTNRWSAWAVSNNVINFSYLPAGTYQLAVQSRDLLGAESAVEEITFQVLPPYWKRWWFYALEFIVFSILVLLAVQLARSDSRYRALSQILSLLTVIMLIQFIQTVIYSLIGIKSSPVIEFFIQVCIALVVYPVENFARVTMLNAAKRRIHIKHFWDKPIDNVSTG